MDTNSLALKKHLTYFLLANLIKFNLSFQENQGYNKVYNRTIRQNDCSKRLIAAAIIRLFLKYEIESVDRF
jgi:hypothetical protein